MQELTKNNYIIKGINFSQLKGKSNNGKILIFLPGIGALKENYSQHLQAFLNSYSSIYSINLPEQGSVGNWSIGTMVENLKTFISYIDNPNINIIHLAGHSAGAIAVLSFLINYNTTVENNFISKKTPTNCNPADKIKKEIYIKQIPESKKVEKIVLYSPPTSLKNEKTKKIILSKITRNQTVVRFTLNLFVNFPMMLFKPFTSGEKTNFKIEKSNKPQYYFFIMDNYRRFLDYTLNYQTIFELVSDPTNINISDIYKALNNKNILIQYGSFDWLIKFFLIRNRSLANLYNISPNVKIVKHTWLGHFLRKKYHLDINLNNQMITNSKVIKESLKFLNS